jgi:hypothetical protein
MLLKLLFYAWSLLPRLAEFLAAMIPVTFKSKCECLKRYLIIGSYVQDIKLKLRIET